MEAHAHVARRDHGLTGEPPLQGEAKPDLERRQREERGGPGLDGDDVVKVKRRIGEAIERARTTGEPTLIEVVTYRFRGHSMSDPGLYRTKDEVEEWKRRDPLTRSRQRLLDLGMAVDAMDALEADVKAEIDDAVAFAESSPAADEYLPYVIKE